MLSIFNDDITITMENETRVRKDRKIYKSPNLLNTLPMSGNIKLYENYKKEIASIDYDLTHLLKENKKEKNNWHQLNQNTEKYVIQIRGFFWINDASKDDSGGDDASKDDSGGDDASNYTFNITKIAIQELLNNNDILLNI
jgi:hypothetical protein